MNVRVLPDDVVNKISAGEVVDRPASIVRELVENALDAGARDIQVHIEDGGQALIRVVDDGSGMERDDALLALERHATSKLSRAEDLFSLTTLGFRGEALPSIAAVSRLTLRTRPGAQDHATEILIEGGSIRYAKDSPGAPGTVVEVRQLFFNTPARKKFLKSARTEELRIRTWLLSSAIARPDVRFRLISDGRELLTLPAHESVMARAKVLFRGDCSACDNQHGEILVQGLFSHPSAAVHDAGALVLLVNGRVISDRLLLRAVREGFDSTLKDREYPLGFLSVSVPPGEVDVNVHPQKSEVRFRQPQSIFEAVRSSVHSAITGLVAPVRTAEHFQPTYRISNDRIAVARELPFSLVQETVHAPSPIQEASIQKSPFHYSKLRYVGQIAECYLIAELDSTLYLVDMHAAHERLNYNRIRNALRERSFNSQQLLVPVTVTLGEQGAERCAANSAVFERYGFEWDRFGAETIIVRAVPGFLKETKVIEVVKELAALAEEYDPQAAFENQVDSIAARLACHASIRSGKAMEREEVYALFADLDDARFSAACPHGRPVSVSFSCADIESWFGRDR